MRGLGYYTDVLAPPAQPQPAASPATAPPMAEPAKAEPIAPAHANLDELD